MQVGSIKVVKASNAPFPAYPIPPESIRSGNPVGRGGDLLQSDDQKFTGGLWICEPGEFEWVFGGDECLIVLEGEVIITQEGGESHTLCTGDMIYFPIGAKTNWKITKRLKEFYVTRTPVPRNNLIG